MSEIEQLLFNLNYILELLKKNEIDHALWSLDNLIFSIKRKERL